MKKFIYVLNPFSMFDTILYKYEQNMNKLLKHSIMHKKAL